jgi:hypothetical protein
MASNRMGDIVTSRSRMMQRRGFRCGPKPEQNPIGEEHRERIGDAMPVFRAPQNQHSTAEVE